MGNIILGIESSCDDTSAAIIKDNKIFANVIANQDIHKKYGGVVPELASREHQKNIIPVVDEAINIAGIKKEDISAIAFTNGPGLMGSLLVGVSFAKAFSLALNVPIIQINHLQAHVLANFIEGQNEKNEFPKFPFLCLLVSGGHTQIIKVTDFLKFEILGQTIDDAAGEAFDKAAKIMGLPYPGGPLIDKFGKTGNTKAFTFPHPNIPDLNFSFSGLKTSILYLIKNKLQEDADFIEKNKEDLCASYQNTIVEILFKKLKKASEETGIKEIAIAGGVSANSALRNKLAFEAKNLDWNLFVPKFEYCTDNAAMVAVAGYYKFLNNEFTDLSASPVVRIK